MANLSEYNRRSIEVARCIGQFQVMHYKWIYQRMAAVTGFAGADAAHQSTGPRGISQPAC